MINNELLNRRIAKMIKQCSLELIPRKDHTTKSRTYKMVASSFAKSPIMYYTFSKTTTRESALLFLKHVIIRLQRNQSGSETMHIHYKDRQLGEEEIMLFIMDMS